jgi:predicted permease
MIDIFTRGGILLGVIILGYTLKKSGFLPPDSFKVLSKIVLNVTLPCAVISSMADMELSVGLLGMTLFGLVCGGILVLLGYLSGRGKDKKLQLLNMFNYGGFNIGCFAMPFVSGQLSLATVIAVCMFDVGNSMWTNGGTNAWATVVKGEEPPKVGPVLKSFFGRPAIIVYILMPILAALNITLPAPIVEGAGFIGSANSFLAMMIIGLGMDLSFDKTKLGWLIKTFFVRFGLATVFAAAAFFLLPFDNEIKLAAMLSVFAPGATINVVFTERHGADVGLASSWNTISILCSLVFMTAIMAMANGLGL